MLVLNNELVLSRELLAKLRAESYFTILPISRQRLLAHWQAQSSATIDWRLPRWEVRRAISWDVKQEYFNGEKEVHV